MGQPDQELRAWLDRLAIQDLIFRYSDAVTRADWDQCETVFAPDAVWESNLGLRFDSRADFMETLKQTSSYDLLIQTPHSSVNTLTGPGQATATTTIHELVRGAEINMDHVGIYYDDLVRIDGGWKFTRRVFICVYAKTGSVTANVLTRRSALLQPD